MLNPAFLLILAYYKTLCLSVLDNFKMMRNEKLCYLYMNCAVNRPTLVLININ